MYKSKIILAFIIVISALGMVCGQSVSKTGTTAAKFLSIGIGPRANGMGGAYTSVANDASSMYWNPAGIANIEGFQGLFTYTKMFADINLNYVGAVITAGEFGKIGINVTSLDFGEMDITTELDPDGTGETFSAGSVAIGLSYARYITNKFVVGATIKYIQENIYNSSASGLAIDVGTIFETPFYGVRFASSISNFGTKMQIDGDDLLIRYDPDETTSGNNETNDAKLATEEFELPLRLQIGVSRDWNFLDNQRFTFAIDANYPNDNQQWVNVGGEYSAFNDLIMFRAGYKTLFLNDSQEGLTLGVGLRYNDLAFFKVGIDYSYQQFEYLANVHSFGLLINF